MVLSIGDAPLAGDDAARPGLDQRRRESLDAFAFHQHTTRRAASGEHDQVRIEPERGQIARTDHAVVAAVGRQRQHRAGRRALVDHGVGGEVDDPEALERRVLEVRRAGRLAQPDAPRRRVACHEPGFATGSHEARQGRPVSTPPVDRSERDGRRRVDGDCASRMVEPSRPLSPGKHGSPKASRGTGADRRGARSRMAPERREDGRGGRHADRVLLDHVPSVGQPKQIPGHAVQRSVRHHDEPRDVGAELGQRRVEQHSARRLGPSSRPHPRAGSAPGTARAARRASRPAAGCTRERPRRPDPGLVSTNSVVGAPSPPVTYSRIAVRSIRNQRGDAVGRERLRLVGRDVVAGRAERRASASARTISVHELPRAPALRQLERTRRPPTGGERGQHPRHARALLAEVGGRGLVLAARDLKGEQPELAIGQRGAPPLELVPGRGGLALGRVEVAAPRVDVRQAQPRVVPRRGAGRCRACARKRWNDRSRREQLAAGEREPPLVERQVPPHCGPSSLGRSARASASARSAAGPVPLADRDRGERLIARRTGPASPRSPGRTPAPRASAVSRPRKSPPSASAISGRNLRAFIALDRSPWASNMVTAWFRCSAAVGKSLSCRATTPSPCARWRRPRGCATARPRLSVRRSASIVSPRSPRFREEVPAVHERDREPAPVPRLPEPPLGFAERRERGVLRPRQSRTLPRPRNACAWTRSSPDRRASATLATASAVAPESPRSARIMARRHPRSAWRSSAERRDERSRGVEDRLGRRHARGGPAGEREPDQRLRFSGLVAGRARGLPGPRELVACRVALAALLERPGTAETGVDGVGIGMQRVGAEETGVEAVGGGIVVGEPREGGEAEPGRAIGGVVLETSGPARAGRGEAVSLDRVQRLAHDVRRRDRGVGAGRDGSGKCEGEEQCDHEQPVAKTVAHHTMALETQQRVGISPEDLQPDGLLGADAPAEP